MNPIKRGKRRYCYRVDTGRIAGVFLRGGVGGFPKVSEGVQGKTGGKTGTREPFPRNQANTDRGGGQKSLTGTVPKTTPPGLRAHSRNCAFLGVFRSHNARPRAWFAPPELPPFPLFSVELFHLREWGYLTRKRPKFQRYGKI